MQDRSGKIVCPERKDSDMLTPQRSQHGYEGRQGCRGLVSVEPEAKAAAPRIPQGIHRQRLLELAERLARVRALGGEYARVEFSPDLARQLGQLVH
jgi:hypothetical protein